MDTKGLTSMPREITQMIAQHIPAEDLKNVACICRKVHDDTADILRKHQALIQEYHYFDIDVLWVAPGHDECPGWEIVGSYPIISLCTILENVDLGHYVRETGYAPDSNGNVCRGNGRHDWQENVNHGGALKTIRNVEVLQRYLSEHQLENDTEQSKLSYFRHSSDPHEEWNKEFVERLVIDYGLYLRILLEVVPNLTTLEINWNFCPYSAIGKFIRAAPEGPKPFLQHLTKVKLLLGHRPHRMDIGAFMAIPSIRWLSIHHLYEFDRWECYPDLVGCSNLTRLELVGCGITDENLCTYFKMFQSLQQVDILMSENTGRWSYGWTWRNSQSVDILFNKCGRTLRYLSMLNIGLEEGLKSLDSFSILQSLTLQFSSLFSLDDREARMISQLPASTETLLLWNDSTEHESEIQTRIKLLGLAKSDGGLSLTRVEVATEYTSFGELQRCQPCIEEDLAGVDISFAFLEKERWPQGHLQKPPEPRYVQTWRKWWAENEVNILK